jgi:hypothetical protein
MLTAFAEFSMFSLGSCVSQFCIAKYAGCFGAGSNALSFSNIKITDDISGLSSGCS